MRVTFATNYLNVHQRPFCSAMLEILGESNFAFVASTPFNELRLRSGYEDMNQEPFVIRAYEDKALAKEAVVDADVVVGIPYSNPDFIRLRMDDSKGLTFAYSERLLKRGLWLRFFPSKWAKVYGAFTCYRRRQDFHVLSASAFTSYDLSLFGFPPERCWKWGYFPVVPEIPERVEPHFPASIVWVARLIQWKRPYLPLQLAKRLVRDGRDFHLTMVGEGEMRGELESYIQDNGLVGHVTMTGSMPNREVHRIMSESDVSLFTSNRMEGWGAVLSEAMGNGCAPVASSLIGSVPYLVRDGHNGRVYPDGDEEALYRCVVDMLDDLDATRCMGERARETMTSLWNPSHAARSFIELSECLLAGERPAIPEGPCSPAGVVTDTWYGGGCG